MRESDTNPATLSEMESLLLHDGSSRTISAGSQASQERESLLGNFRRRVLGSRGSSPRLSWKLSLFVLFPVFLTIALTIHYRGLASPMVYDSVGYFVEKGQVFRRGDLVGVLQMVPQRPLVMGSFYINYLLTGMNVSWFRLCNIAVLAASGVAFVMLVSTILDTPPFTSTAGTLSKWGAPIWAGLCFTVHPLHVFDVLYIWQRAVIMACFFYFAALAAYIAARSGRIERGRVAYVFVGVMFMAGMLCKEHVVTLPIVLFLVELLLFRGCPPGLLKQAKTIAAIVLPGLTIHFLATFLLLGPETELGQEGFLTRIFSYYNLAGVSPTQVLFTECRVVFSYLSYILIPWPAGQPFLKAYVISTSLWSPPVTIAAVAGIVGTLGVGFRVARTKPLVAFGIFFFLVSLIPESVLLPQYLFTAHRAILPMAGALLCMTHLVLSLAATSSSRPAKLALGTMLIIPLCYLSVATYSRAREWRPLTFWQESYAQLPPFSREVEKYPYIDIAGNYASELINASDYSEAVSVLRKLVEIDLGTTNDKTLLARVKLGAALCKAGDVNEGIAVLRRTAESYSAYPLGHIGLGQALADTGQQAKAIEPLRRAIELSPSLAAPRILLAEILTKQGKLPEAIGSYQDVLKIDPYCAECYNGLGVAYEKLGDLPSALRNYERAVQLAPQSAELNFNLAKALAKTGDITGATDRYAQTVLLKPDFAPAIANLGALYLNAGRLPEALRNFENALTLVHDNAQLYYLSGLALERMGKRELARERFRKALDLNPDHAQSRQALENLERSNPEGSAARQ